MKRALILALGLLVALGTLWALTRPGAGGDFKVFYQAFSLILEGRSIDLYRDSPDRYLYAPGLAILGAPLAALPLDFALALLCLLKALVLGLFVSQFRNLDRDSLLAPLIAILICARPLLIEIQYGQINLFLVLLSFFTLHRFFSGAKSSLSDVLLWFLTTCLTMTKFLTLPVLALPFLMRADTRVRAAIIAGAAVSWFLPILLYGDAGFVLLQDWWAQVLDKGFPTESHNQSFRAFLVHLFSEEGTYVRSVGPEKVESLGSWLTPYQIYLLSAGWITLSVAFIASLLFQTRSRSPLTWISLLLGFCLLPAHLIWKPYFVFSIPIFTALVREHQRTGGLKGFLIFCAVAINFASLDVLGPQLNAWAEMSALLLWVHVAALTVLWLRSSSFQTSPASSSRRGRLRSSESL